MISKKRSDYNNIHVPALIADRQARFVELFTKKSKKIRPFAGPQFLVTEYLVVPEKAIKAALSMYNGLKINYNIAGKRRNMEESLQNEA